METNSLKIFLLNKQDNKCFSKYNSRVNLLNLYYHDSIYPFNTSIILKKSKLNSSNYLNCIEI